MISGNVNRLDYLIRQNRSFAIYRLPGEEQPVFLMQEDNDLQQISCIKGLNGQSGFVIAPFRITENQPAVLIRPDIRTIPETAIRENNSGSSGNISLKTNEPGIEKMLEYKESFNKFMAALQSGEVEKLVLSRCRELKGRKGFSPGKAFGHACNTYTRSFVYLYHTPVTGTWLGSTPELLLSGNQGVWQTVALAGTQTLQNGELPDKWNDKNRKEQQLVTDYIRYQLASVGIAPEISDPYTVRAAHLAHLKTEFSFRLEEAERLGDLLGLLHPTPAIAGIPKEKAVDFILRNEGYGRSLYSGFTGMLNPEYKTDIYVNLRCMQVGDDTLTLYAGSGLIAGSSWEEEWLETEEKLQTMMKII